VIVLKAIKLFVFRILWQWFGIRWVGESLISALVSNDENIRTIAGMFLVQTGERSRPIVEASLAENNTLPILLTILGDIGDAGTVRKLELYTHNSDPEIVRAADDALIAIKLRQQKADLHSS